MYFVFFEILATLFPKILLGCGAVRTAFTIISLYRYIINTSLSLGHHYFTYNYSHSLSYITWSATTSTDVIHSAESESTERRAETSKDWALQSRHDGQLSTKGLVQFSTITGK